MRDIRDEIVSPPHSEKGTEIHEFRILLLPLNLLLEFLFRDGWFVFDRSIIARPFITLFYTFLSFFLCFSRGTSRSLWFNTSKILLNLSLAAEGMSYNKISSAIALRVLLFERSSFNSISENEDWKRSLYSYWNIISKASASASFELKDYRSCPI